MKNERDEAYHCHLVLMEFYEKVFLFAWIYLIITWVVLMLSCGVLMILPLPVLSRYFLQTHTKRARKIKSFLRSELDFGDLFILYLIKDHVSEALFIKILEGLVEMISKLKEENVMEENLTWALGKNTRVSNFTNRLNGFDIIQIDETKKENFPKDKVQDKKDAPKPQHHLNKRNRRVNFKVPPGHKHFRSMEEYFETC